MFWSKHAHLSHWDQVDPLQIGNERQNIKILKLRNAGYSMGSFELHHLLEQRNIHSIQISNDWGRLPTKSLHVYHVFFHGFIILNLGLSSSFLVRNFLVVPHRFPLGRYYTVGFDERQSLQFLRHRSPSYRHEMHVRAHGSFRLLRLLRTFLLRKNRCERGFRCPGLNEQVFDARGNGTVRFHGNWE